ncbi:MAG TPA: TIGR03435 family protein [Vicinamibacterales bacterium]|nr:TIGR03435 family protein [Vicinamibacterales bacterium]
MLFRCARFVVVAAIAAATVSAQQLPTFEVASVKASSPFDVQKVMSGQQRIGIRMDAGRVAIDGLPLSDIINTAFRVKSYQVTAPGWLASGMSSPRFDIHATLPAGATTEQVPEMLQALLAERFKLTYHREMKDQSVYALIVAKGGPKLVESPPDQPAGDAGAPPSAGPGPSGLIGRGGPPVPLNANGRGNFTIAGGGTGPVRVSMADGALHIEADKLSMTQLSDTLARLLDRPVVDQTALKGNYKVVLELALADMMNAVRAAGVNLPPGAFGAGPAAPGGAPTAPDPSGGSTVFRSVEQLGLKLDSRKMAIEQIIIDHLERTPTED